MLYAEMKAICIHICIAFISFMSHVSCLCVQAYSLKLADPTKLEDYFVYLAKGINGKKGDRVRVLYEGGVPRLWDVLHEQYHRVRGLRLARNAAEGPQDFYGMLAEKCKSERKTSKEDVLAAVVKYYVEDAKKGFSSFQLQATFGRVFSLVNGTQARQFFYDNAAAQLFS